MIFILLYLTYFTFYDNLQVHPCVCKWHDLIIFDDIIIFHCLHVPHLLYPFFCQWKFRLLVSLGYFEDSAMNIGVIVSFKIMVFSKQMHRSEIDRLDRPYDSSIFMFLGTSVLFTIVVVPIYIPTNSVVSPPSLAFIVCRLFDDDYSVWSLCKQFYQRFMSNEFCLKYSTKQEMIS